MVLAIVLSGCVVKSLHPFYTKETVAYDNSLIGHWEDTENDQWSIRPIADKLTGEDKKGLKLPEVLDLGYLVDYKMIGGIRLEFIAIPFRIKEQLFLDFILFDVEGKDNLDFLFHHMISVHTLAKVDKSGDKLYISWFAQDKIEQLFEEDKIRLKHEKMDIDGTYLLTASSKELQKFITKYMDAEVAEKWETSVKFTLNKK